MPAETYDEQKKRRALEQLREDINMGYIDDATCLLVLREIGATEDELDAVMSEARRAMR